MTRKTLDDRLTSLNMPIVEESESTLAWPLPGMAGMVAIYDPRAVANGFVLKVEGEDAHGCRVDFGFSPTGSIARCVYDGAFIPVADAERILDGVTVASDSAN